MSQETITRERMITFDRKLANDEARTVPASLSSDAPVRMPWGNEVLVHSKDAIDLTRAKENGLPMLFNHDRDQPIGRVKDVTIEDGKLRGIMHFSNNSRAQEVYRDIVDGMLSDTSITYEVHDYDERDETIYVNRWAVTEASVVTIPADISVGINRSKEDPIMDKDDDTKTPAAEPKVVDFSQARQLAIQEGRAEGQRQERERIDGIRALFAMQKFTAPIYKQFESDAITRGLSLAEVQSKLIDMIGEGVAPITDPGQRDDARAPDVSHGRSQNEKFLDIAERTLSVRGGLEEDETIIKEVNESGYRTLSLMELAREYLRSIDVNTSKMQRQELAGSVFTRSLISHGTDDFVNILANVANKAALRGWTEAPETWNVWTRQGSLPDFKQADRSGLGEFEDLEIVYENGKYQYAKMTDRKESLKLVTWGKMFSISRQAIINDDLSEFTTVPRKMGRAANRKVGDVVYEVLTTNPTLNQTGNALFHTSHNNLVTPGAEPSVNTLNEAKAAMKLQQDNDKIVRALNIIPEFILSPVALEATVRSLLINQYDPAGTAGTLPRNPHQNTLTPVIEPRLDLHNNKSWYLAANPNTYDTVEVAFLDGNSAPYLEEQQGFSMDGVTFKVRIDAVAAALAYQSLFKNEGGA